MRVMKPFCIVDLETTGFDVNRCGVTQLGLTRIDYSPSLGRMTRIVSSASFFNDPGHPIPEEITRLTGITDQDVHGKSISRLDIEPFFVDDPICIAHNASFDRPFAHQHLPVPKSLRWACSLDEVNWAGFESRKLSWLLYQLGYFYDGHRADTDTQALAWLFYKRSDALKELLEQVDKRTATIRAYDSPFESKDALKEKGFRWNDKPGDKNIGLIPVQKMSWNI